MRYDLTLACLLAGGIVAAIPGLPLPRHMRPEGAWRFFCGSIDHDHPTSEGADFCRELRCASKR
jgi:hypothetical protein